jgi:hypothetical protein
MVKLADKERFARSCAIFLNDPSTILPMRILTQAFAALRRELDFTSIYRGNGWGDTESKSGIGSRRDSHAVRHSLELLSSITKSKGVRSIADIPCGDFNWIGVYISANPDVTYTGYDIVLPLIKRNRRLFPHQRFEHLDIVREVPGTVDLIFCKDLLNHLEDWEIIVAIDNMQKSGSKWLLASNNFGYENRPLRRTKRLNSRHVDLTAPPFRYPQPIWHDHYLGLWDLEQLKPAPT